MKKTFILCLLTLLIGAALGWGVGQFANPALPRAASPAALITAPASAAPQAALDQGDNGPLLERGQAVLKAMKARDYPALAALAHPEKGVRFTPYSTVDPDSDLELTSERLAAAGEDSRAYTWGISDGKGSPLVYTIPDYFALFVFNADYTTAPLIGVDTVLESGNALENASDAYPEGRYVEYHFPGLVPENQGFDWCSLKLVFEVWENDWYLTGVIHSQWTI
ncbi:MAG: hypothetical protein MR272_01495 [Pseudoflavonifractor sp.]|nr:hypothetical protein [Pseudoflavonifractor sp.]MDY3020352.1 hypothetical protein [Oscillospiraceae bacterium]